MQTKAHQCITESIAETRLCAEIDFRGGDLRWLPRSVPGGGAGGSRNDSAAIQEIIAPSSVTMPLPLLQMSPARNEIFV